MTTQSEIGAWFDQGIEQGATHMLVVCDTFDWDDYPVYAKGLKDAHERVKAAHGGMNKLMEVYDLSMSKDEQLKAGRVFNLAGCPAP